MVKAVVITLTPPILQAPIYLFCSSDLQTPSKKAVSEGTVMVSVEVEQTEELLHRVLWHAPQKQHLMLLHKFTAREQV